MRFTPCTADLTVGQRVSTFADEGWSWGRVHVIGSRYVTVRHDDGSIVGYVPSLVKPGLLP